MPPLLICKCPCGCKDTCYFRRFDRQAVQDDLSGNAPKSKMFHVKQSPSLPPLTQEEEMEQIRRYMPPYIQDLAEQIKAENSARTNAAALKAVQHKSPIHPLHLIWAFVLLGVVVFNKQFFELLQLMIDFAK